MDIAFTTSGENVVTTYLNEGEIENRNIHGLTFKDKPPKDHEKLFGMTEDMIYKKFGLHFTETKFSARALILKLLYFLREKLVRISINYDI